MNECVCCVTRSLAVQKEFLSEFICFALLSCQNMSSFSSYPQDFKEKRKCFGCMSVPDRWRRVTVTLPKKESLDSAH